MRTRAAVLCGAAVVVAGSFTAAPADAGPRHTTGPDVQARQLAWKKCGTTKYPKLQCASLKVPLDHAHPQGRQITLALSRIPHTAKKSQGPLLVNPGGPGGSGLTLAGFVASSLPKSVAAQYDVIGFDPRGVGKSTPALNCEPGHFKPVRPDSVPSTAALEKAGLDRARSFAAACHDKYASVLPYIDTVSTARDLDSIRRALGAGQVSYFGYSYGTYLGAVYAKLYPQRVRRLVLDSIVDPTSVWYDGNLAQDRSFNDRHRALMAWIARHDSTYRLGTDPAKVEAEWYAMRAALAKKPAGGRVGASELEDTFMPGGYYNGYWPHLADAFASYVNGRKSDALVDAYNALGAVDSSGENGYSVYAAVQCRDASWPRDWAQWRKDNRDTAAKAPFMTWNNAWYNAPCLFWQTPPLKPVSVTNDKLSSALLFQATNDAATPYIGGVTAHRLLDRSSLVVEQGGGNHGITLNGNACLDKYLAAYLADGKVPHSGGEIDAVCKKSPDPKPLTTKAISAQPPGTALHDLLGYGR